MVNIRLKKSAAISIFCSASLFGSAIAGNITTQLRSDRGDHDNFILTLFPAQQGVV